MKYLILTNNIDVCKSVEENPVTGFELLYLDAPVTEVYEKIRDLVHKNYCLITHPLSGSIKPNQTPFKTAILKKSYNLNMESLSMIENAIERFRTFEKDSPILIYSEKTTSDFRLIDLDIYKSALSSLI